jgi:hypothetical protein
MNHETWQFVNTFAPWLSAIGTIAAVVTSLWLARNRTRVRLTVSVRLGFIVEPDAAGEYDGPRQEYVCIGVVNTGETEATITSIGWLGRPGWRRTAWLQNLDDDQYAGSKLPVRLKFGEEVSFRLRLQPHWLNSASEDMIGRFPWISAYALRLVIWTSIGQSFKVHPERKILAKLVEAAKAREK